jgi:hypothetical protein
MADASHDHARPIRRTVRESSRHRGVREGAKRGAYNTSRHRDPVQPREWVTPPSYVSLAEVPVYLLARAREKARWVRRYLNDGCRHGTLARYAREYADSQGIPENEIPPYPTLHRWAAQLREFGELGLVDSVSNLAGRPQVKHGTPSITPRQERLIALGLKAGQLGVADILRVLARNHIPGETLPSKGVVRRVIMRFQGENPHLTNMSHNGRIAHRSLIEMSLSQGVLPGGYRVAIDSTVADIYVRVPDASKPS